MLGSPCVLVQLQSRHVTPVRWAPLMEGLAAAPAAAAAVATAAAAVGAASTDTSAGFNSTGSCLAAGRLPRLCRLVVDGPMVGLVEAWLASPLAPQLTALCVDPGIGFQTLSMPCLEACSGLRELQLCNLSVVGWRDADELLEGQTCSEELQGCTSLTKLVLQYQRSRLQEVPPSVWGLTQLCHLDLACGRRLEELPNGVSCLQQLTLLRVKLCGLTELPHQLGVWLPRVRELDVSGSQVAAIPHGMQHLSRLYMRSCPLATCSAVEHLVNLRVLDTCIGPENHMYIVHDVAAPIDSLTHLSALEELALNVAGDSVLVTSSPLPRLRRLSLAADFPVRVVSQLAGAGQHLSFLELRAMGDQQDVDDLRQLRVLPVLQELRLYGNDITSLVSVGPWLQQHPQLTSLHVSSIPYGCPPGLVPQLGLLPPHLEQLIIKGAVAKSDLSGMVEQLTCLRLLTLECESQPPLMLPSCLSRLSRLEEVVVRGTSDEGWDVLGQLPLLRAARGMHGSPAALLCAAPHLCFA